MPEDGVGGGRVPGAVGYNEALQLFDRDLEGCVGSVVFGVECDELSRMGIVSSKIGPKEI